MFYNIKSKIGFEKFYQDNYKMLFYFVYSKINCYDDVNDIVQDSFVSFYKSLEQIDLKKNYRNYLITIAKNKCIDYYAQNIEMIRGKEISDKSEYKPNTISFDTIIKKMIEKCGLSKDEIDILMYKHKYGLKFKEIASIYNVSVDSITSKYSRIRNKIKKTSRKEDYYE